MPQGNEKGGHIGKIKFVVVIDIYAVNDPEIRKTIREETLAGTLARLRMLILVFFATILGFKFEANEEETTEEVIG